MSVYVVIAQLHRDAVDHCVRPVAAITAVINVPKHWDELTPSVAWLPSAWGAVRRAPGFPRESWPHRASFNVGHRGSLAAGQRRELYRLRGWGIDRCPCRCGDGLLTELPTVMSWAEATVPG